MSGESFLNGKVTLHRGDCLEVMTTLEPDSVDSVVCDPPYHLTSIVKRFGGDKAAPCQFGTDGAYARASKGFMGKQWDGGGIAFDPATWALVLRVLKPGGHLLAFSGTRTYHRMACAIEDAGFEIRDQIGWCYGSGFPKSHAVDRAIEGHLRGGKSRYSGNDNLDVEGCVAIPGSQLVEMSHRTTDKGFTGKQVNPTLTEAIQWQGWGTALKPAWEPICLARKPLSESSIAVNVLKHGTGGINVDGCRIGVTDGDRESWERLKGFNNTPRTTGRTYANGAVGEKDDRSQFDSKGRWPANLIHDGSEEVLAGFPESVSNTRPPTGRDDRGVPGFVMRRNDTDERGHSDSGSAARFFYTAKADSDDRLGSKHPTVKPLDLIQYLVRLVTPRGGVVLDPFAGTGTCGEAAFREGMAAILIEREQEYQADIVKRMGLCLAGPEERRREIIKATGMVQDAGPLFGGSEAIDKRVGRQIYGVYADEKGGPGRR